MGLIMTARKKEMQLQLLLQLIMTARKKKEMQLKTLIQLIMTARKKKEMQEGDATQNPDPVNNDGKKEEGDATQNPDPVNNDGKKEGEELVSVIDDAQEQDVPHGPNVMKMVMCIAAGGFVIGLGLLGYLLVVKRYSAREIAEPTVEMTSTSSEMA